MPGRPTSLTVLASAGKTFRQKLEVFLANVEGFAGEGGGPVAAEGLVPEPSTWAMLTLGLLAPLGFRRRKRD